MSPRINILMSSDDLYAQHMGVTIVSVLESTALPSLLSFYLIDAGIRAENRAHLQGLIENQGAECHWLYPATERMSGIRSKRYGTAGLLRILAPHLLPEAVHTIIYLDCDVILCDDVARLQGEGSGGRTVAAVTNLGHQPTERLGIDDGEYFNSGVLLIDLERWRQLKVTDRVIDYMVTNNDELIYPDQDGLNVVLQGEWHHLSLRWNMQPATYRMWELGRVERGLTTEQFDEAVTHPAVVHFLGLAKPWNYYSFHPLKQLYDHYLQLTPWCHYRPKDRTPYYRIKRWLSFGRSLKQWRRRGRVRLSRTYLTGK